MFDDQLTQIATALVAHCKAGTERQGLTDLYAPDAVSVEAAAMGEMGRVTEGAAGIQGKHDWWDANAEVHEFEVQGPFLHGDDRFALIFKIDVTMKDSGERMPMEEVAIYSVADGKIVREEFYYGLPPA